MPARQSILVSDTVKSAVVTCVDCVCRLAWVVMIGALATNATFTVYTSRNLDINTDVKAVMSPEPPFQRADADFKKAFPYFAETLVTRVVGLVSTAARNRAGAPRDQVRNAPKSSYGFCSCVELN